MISTVYAFTESSIACYYSSRQNETTRDETRDLRDRLQLTDTERNSLKLHVDTLTAELEQRRKVCDAIAIAGGI